MNVAELTGLALDYWVARSLPDFVREIYFTDSGETVAVRGNDRGRPWDGRFMPTDSWEAAGVVLDRTRRVELREGEPAQNLNNALVDARRLIDDLNNNVGPLAKDMLATLEQARHTLLAAQATVSPDSTLYFQLNRTLREIQAMASSIRVFADYMQRHPDALLTGKR